MSRQDAKSKPLGALVRVARINPAAFAAVSAFLILAFLIFWVAAASAAVSCSSYTAIPPFLAESVQPSTTIILDNSGSMFEHAYQERETYWSYGTGGDWRPSSADFNSTKEYYGYFDSYKYYSYDAGAQYFYEDSSGSWNGNFLNWAFMHRVDAARQVLTGGDYYTSGSDYILTIEYTDGSNSRGKYHTYNDTNPVQDLNGDMNYMTPHRYAFGIGQWGYDYYGHIRKCTSIQNQGTATERWIIETTDQDSFKLQVKTSTEPEGVLDAIAPKMRLALFVYDYDNGGKVVQYMGASLADMKSSINTAIPSTWTPLAETLYTVIGYIKQTTANSNGPHYESDSYSVGTTYDPFYFSDLGELVECTNQNVILITDGESTMDKNIPAELQDYDSDGDDPGTFASDGSDYLDDVALYGHTQDLRSDLDGTQTIDFYAVFAFGAGSNLLVNATINGGFTDKNSNDIPDLNEEWDRDEDGMPDNYFAAESGADIEAALIEVFSSIMERASAGSAASVIAASRSGEGALYQAIFWPKKTDAYGNEVHWIGDVHAYMVDEIGRIYEDTNENNALDTGDQQVTLFYDETLERTRACVGGNATSGSCSGGITREINEVYFLWSISDWLNDPAMDPVTQRSSYLADEKKRYIFTWYDSDNDGANDSGEVIDFTAANAVPEVNATIVNWVRGQDQTGMRSRFYQYDVDHDGFTEDTYWRLGDVIHSTPTVIGAPTENYDIIWGDTSYAAFYRQYRDRRLMVYFGGNDGMLHAVNGGFYSYEDRKFCRGFEYDVCSDTGPELGAEMWAYVPYNLLPHLQCLTDGDYDHQYYVDLKPRVFDVRIFPNDSKHPNGWGTILVGGMRLGGTTVTENGREFSSSYFILDITDPEQPPDFLGEVTFNSTATKPSEDLVEIGYSMSIPTVVPVRGETIPGQPPGEELEWYLIFGNGPEDMAGTSSDKAAIVVIPLEEYLGVGAGNYPTLRIPNTEPSETTTGVISGMQTSSQDACISTGFVSVDWNFDFFTDMFYFGTVTFPTAGGMSGDLFRLRVKDRSDPKNWTTHPLVKDVGPVSGEPNVGWYDDDVWVYFGTGRYWVPEDKLVNEQRSMFGIREMNITTNPAYNFPTVTMPTLVDVTDVFVEPETERLFCGSNPSSTACLPKDASEVMDYFWELVDYITLESQIHGWKRDLPEVGERIIGQPTLLGGIVNFVSFMPNDDICEAEGDAYLYALYYLTGTAWIENVFGGEDEGYVEYRVSLGGGMSITASLHLGSEEGVKAFIQTSTGEIVEVEEPNLPVQSSASERGGWHAHDFD